MEVTLLGTGSPVPLLDRAGSSIHISVSDDDLLFDCGPRVVYELMRNEINPGAIEDLFFTHHHIDHNASFFHFVIAGWTLGGRHSLTVYGPPGTERLLDALYSIYGDDIAYRKHIGYSAAGIDDIELRETTEDMRVVTDSYQITALPVEHSTITYAYRITEAETGASFVYSGDTRQLSTLASFAEGADVLVHDCCIGPVTDSPPKDGFIWDSYVEPMDGAKRERLSNVHCGPAEVGAVAQEAGVDTVVLTHLLPYRDTDALATEASSVFDGRVIVAEDGMTIPVP